MTNDELIMLVKVEKKGYDSSILELESCRKEMMNMSSLLGKHLPTNKCRGSVRRRISRRVHDHNAKPGEEKATDAQPDQRISTQGLKGDQDCGRQLSTLVYLEEGCPGSSNRYRDPS